MRGLLNQLHPRMICQKQLTPTCHFERSEKSYTPYFANYARRIRFLAYIPSKQLQSKIDKANAEIAKICEKMKKDFPLEGIDFCCIKIGINISIGSDAYNEYFIPLEDEEILFNDHRFITI
jgi:hypothetical protein